MSDESAIDVESLEREAREAVRAWRSWCAGQWDAKKHYALSDAMHALAKRLNIEDGEVGR